MNHIYRASIGDINICPMTWEDNEKYRVLRNAPNNRKYFFQSMEISIEQQKKWYQEYLCREGEYMFSIRRKGGHFIGACGIYNVNNKKKSAEFGRILIDPRYRKRGAGVKATRAALNVAQNCLGLKRLTLHVKENNVVAIGTYKRAGFEIFAKDDETVEMFLDLS